MTHETTKTADVRRDDHAEKELANKQKETRRPQFEPSSTATVRIESGNGSDTAVLEREI